MKHKEENVQILFKDMRNEVGKKSEQMQKVESNRLMPMKSEKFSTEYSSDFLQLSC